MLNTLRIHIRFFDDDWMKVVDDYIGSNPNLFQPQTDSSAEVGDDHELVRSITAQEIISILGKCKSRSASGNDGIQYFVLKEGPAELFEILSIVFNACLRLGYFPTAWKEAGGIMLLKKDKDPKQPGSHRPISLLSCIGKLYESVIASRLRTYLEEKQFFNKWQKAYRNGCEGIEHVHRLVEDVRNGFHKSWVTGAVFLDVEKAFDSVWHNGLRYKLHELGLPTKLVRLLSSFLTDRTIKVKVDREVSEPVHLNAGTPQGSVPSPLLYILYVNDIQINPKHQVELSQFADDLGLWVCHKNAGVVERRLGRALADLERWCSKWRIKLNAAKTQLIVFTKRHHVPDPKLTLFGVDLTRSTEVNFLGILLDHRLTLAQHVKATASKAMKRVNLLRRLRGTSWGASSSTLLKVYKAYVRPIMEYGAIITNHVSDNVMKSLQVVQNKALRIALHVPYRTRTADMHLSAEMETVRERLSYLSDSTLSRIEGSVLMEESRMRAWLYRGIPMKQTTDG